ncbi:MAG: hypothetical protein ACYTBS_13130 [Planctomycetota bacterium]
MKNVDIEAVIFRLSEIARLRNIVVGTGLAIITAVILVVAI